MFFDDDEDDLENQNDSVSEFNPNSFMQENENNIEEVNVPIEDNNDKTNQNYYFNQLQSNSSNNIESNNQNENIINPDAIDDNDDEVAPVLEDYLSSNNDSSENNNYQNNSNVNDNIVKEEQENENQSFDNRDDEDYNYYERKISPEEAEKSIKKSEPKQLNKKLLMTIIVCVLGGVLLFTFLMPAKSKKTSSSDEKKIASKNRVIDFESLANPQYTPEDTYDVPVVTNQKEEKPTVRTTSYDENGNVIIPPVIEKKTYDQVTTTTSSSTTVEIPNTRNDGLHEKSISGIKGLTSSQQSYSTDYRTQVEKNVASTTRQNNYTLPSKEDFMQSALSSYSSVYANQNPYATQNDQSGKNSFYNNGRTGEGIGDGEYLNLNTIWQGTILEAVLTSELNTDLPGEITARVSKNVYSSQDGRFLLIPQNSILYGSYNSSISYAQSRVQVGWHTLIRPDGYKINLGNMNASDAKGASGLKGLVNDHPFAYLKAIGLMSVFSIINSEFQSTMGDTDNDYVQNIIANTQQVTNELGEKLIDRAMNVQPTIKIKSGTKINIVANQTLSLPPYEQIPVTQKYKKF